MTLNYHIITPIIALIAASTVAYFRIRATRKPAQPFKMIIPPLGMTTGFFMFLYPPTHIPWLWAMITFLAGCIFLAIPLIQTSRFEVRDGQIYLKRSKAFVVVLLLLLSIRIALHPYVEHHLNLYQTGAVFFILAYGMLLPWRITMYVQLKRLQKNIPSSHTLTEQIHDQ